MRVGLTALLLLALTAAPLRAAETVAIRDSVPVRGGLHEGYGRLVFDWPREVGYQAKVVEGRLVMTFDTPAAFEGAVMQRGLAGYAGAPQVAEDGRRLSLPLNDRIAMKHFRLGPKVVVDLRQAAATPAEAPVEAAAKAPAQPAAEALPRVRVRAGRHQGFSRLVFDWQAPVGELLEEAPGRARLLFDRQAQFDLSGVDTARLPQIGGISATPDAVTLELPSGSRVKVERSGTKVVLDVFGEAPAAAEAPKAPEAAATASDAKPVADLTPRAEAPKAAEPTAAAAAPSEQASDAPTPLVPQAMGGTAAAPAAPAPAAAPAPVAAATKSSKPQPAAAAAPVDSSRGSLAISTDPLPDFLTSRAQGPKAEPFVSVTLTFAWDQPTTAAAFRRGEHLWLVFDRPAPADVVQRIAAEAPHLGEVQLLEEAGATILLIRALPTVAPRLSRDGSRWTVELRPRSPLPEKALAAPLVETEEGGRVRYPVVGAGRMLWVTDPDAGDRLVIVPIRGEGMGLTLPYVFPQFRSLQTHQGIVLQPLTSAVEVAVVSSGVLVRDRNGLLVSRPEERRTALRAGEPPSASPGLLKLDEWRRGGIEEFQRNRQDLQRAATAEAGDRLGLARLELARFYFAHGLNSETLGVLTVIEGDNPRLALDPEVLLMKGASQLMLKDYAGATATLAHPALAGEREALLWQAALAAEAEDWPAAATGFAAAVDLIEPYPRNLRLALGLAAAESFLQTGSPEAAGAELAQLRRLDLDERERAQVDVVQGRLQLAAGDPDQARALWSAVRDGPHRASQARARLALIELGMEEGELSPAAATEELERLRFAWRGDLFEFTLLRELADLYVQQHRHRDALLALREAVTHFPDGPVARNAAQRMREIFAEIYQGPGDPAVPPLRALALYQEFMELTPAGPEGDRIIAGLADRLVEVDLLERAAELLEGQVRYRLEGAEKARIGARLALVRLLDRNPEASLEALDFSAAEGLDEALVGQRRQLKARALAALGKVEEALAALESDDSLEAEQLRADIHWDRRAWPEAAASLAKLVPLLPPRRPLADEEAKLVVNLATALLLADDRVALADLERRYGAAMEAGPRADTFKLLVGDGEPVATASIASELAKVGVAQDFMASYREHLSRENLSAVN